jgi:hypothetical protein
VCLQKRARLVRQVKTLSRRRGRESKLCRRSLRDVGRGTSASRAASRGKCSALEKSERCRLSVRDGGVGEHELRRKFFEEQHPPSAYVAWFALQRSQEPFQTAEVHAHNGSPVWPLEASSSSTHLQPETLLGNPQCRLYQLV